MQRDWPRGIEENLGTRENNYSSTCNDKKGQHNEVILMGMGMQINYNFGRCSTKEESSVSHDRITTSYGRSSTKEESLVSDDKITTSSSMSSTRKESTQVGAYSLGKLVLCFFMFVVCRFCTSKQSFGYVLLNLGMCVFVKVFVPDWPKTKIWLESFQRPQIS